VTLQTRKPTGLPSWPIALIGGVEGSGKSWKIVEASASDLIHRTLWIGCGEDDPDEYGIIPGARFEIVLHDGTYRGILAAVTAACAEPAGPKGEPNMIVVDSGSRFWEQLKDAAQDTANDRLIRKARRNNRVRRRPRRRCHHLPRPVEQRPRPLVPRPQHTPRPPGPVGHHVPAQVDHRVRER
jgi:hypothetical protein